MVSKATSFRFGFVVLHYLVDDATVACIESIRRSCAQTDYVIVVVDNNSANGSYERLEYRYGEVNDVVLMHNECNEGFARGNNVGYRYCREVLGCDYVVSMNNDTMLDCSDFTARCIADYQERGCAVIGPKIISGKDGHNQNPVRSIVDSRQKAKAMRVHIRRNLLLLHLRLLEPLTALKDRISGAGAAHGRTILSEDQPYKLHGSCLIFTPMFLQCFHEPFDPGTFLYLEEDILYLRCQRAGLSMYYDANILVHHEEDVSTDSSVRHDERRKRMLYLRHHRDSLKALEKYFD